MKESVNEYGRIIILVVVLVALAALIFGGVWYNYVGKVSDGIIKDPTVDEIGTRAAPTLNAQDQTTAINKNIDIRAIISAYDADGIDITSNIKVKGDPTVYNDETGIFMSPDAGKFTLILSVTDDYSSGDLTYPLTTTKKMIIMVDNSVGQYTITIRAINNGSITTSSAIANEGDVISVAPSPNLGYEYNGFTLTNELNEEILDVAADTTTFSMPAADVILTPKWQTKQVLVAFNANKGILNGAETKLVRYNEFYSDLPTATRVGYTFDGWYTQKTGGEKVLENTLVFIADTHTLYAHWTPNVYTLSFDADGGTIVGDYPILATYGERVGTLPTATKDGYIFKGWRLSTDNTYTLRSSTKYLKTEDTTFIAVWQSKSCNVYFDANGGSCSVRSSTYYFGQQYGTLPEPVYYGYNFLGWYTAPVDGEHIVSTSTVNSYSGIRLYAHWEKAVYTVTFNPCCDGLVSSTATIGYKDYIVLPSQPSNGSLVFLGWYTSIEGGTKITSKTQYSYIGDKTFYAHWGGQQVTVSFDGNGAAVPIASIGVLYQGVYPTLPIPNDRQGFVFDGWMLNGTKITTGSRVTTSENHTLVASWKSVQYKAYFYMNEDDALARNNNYRETRIYSFADSFDVDGSLLVPSMDGYYFNGWHTSVYDGVTTTETAISNDSIYNYTSDLYIYAKWLDGSIIYFNDSASAIDAAGYSDNISLLNNGDPIRLNGDDAYAVCDTGNILGDLTDDNTYSNWAYNIISVIVGNGVTDIANNAFADCIELTNVTLNNTITSIGDNAFANTAITSMNIPASVETLGIGMCENCRSLQSLVFLGNSYDNFVIPERAFYNCINLNNNNGLLIIPNGVVSIGYEAFALYDIQSSPYYSTESNCTWGVNSGNGDISSVYNAPVLPSAVTAGQYLKSLPVEYSSMSFSSIVLPKGLVVIEDYAFCSNPIQGELIIPASVQTIGNFAFASTCIQKLTFANSDAYADADILNGAGADLQSIGIGTFAYCAMLEGDLLLSTAPDYNEIAPLCFLGCDMTNAKPSNYDSLDDNIINHPDVHHITSVIIPDNIRYFSYYSYGECYKGNKDFNTVNYYSYAFYGCNAIENLSIPINIYYATSNNLVISASSPIKCITYTRGTSATYGDFPDVAIPANKTVNDTLISSEDYVSPDFITSIEVAAFRAAHTSEPFNTAPIAGFCESYTNSTQIVPGDRENIQSIVISNGIANIGKYALYGITTKDFSYPIDIDIFDIQSATPSAAIYDYFTGFKMTNLKMTKGVTSVNNGSLSYITWKGYDGCLPTRKSSSTLTTVVIEDGVKLIPDSINIIGIILDSNKQGGMFYGCKQITDITLPVDLSYSETTFGSCSGVYNVVYTPGCTGRGMEFVNTNVYGSNGEIPINDTPFADAKSSTHLINIKYKDGVTYLGKYTFAFGYFDSVILPNSLVSANSKSLFYSAKINSLTIPITFNNYTYVLNDKNTMSMTTCPLSSVTFIPGLTGISPDFDATSCLELPWSLSTSASVNVNFSDEIYTYSDGSGTHNSSITHIGSYLLYGAKLSSTNIDIPKSVTSIGIHAFPDTVNTYTFNSNLTATELSLTNTENITNIILGPAVTTISEGVLQAFNPINAINIKGNVTADAYRLIANYVPNIDVSGEGYTIPDNTFSGSTSTSSIVLYDTYKYIGNNAFANSTLDIYFTDTDGITDGVSNFSNNINAGAVIGDGAFMNTGVEFFPITVSLVSIGDQAFYNCTSLTEVSAREIADSSTPRPTLTVGDQAFENCTSLPSVCFNSNLKIIGNRAFMNCGLLSSFYSIVYDEDGGHNAISNNILSIGNSAFEGCSVLTDMSLADGLTTIGDRAFYGCGLNSITLPETTQSLGVASFGNNPFSHQDNSTLIIPNNITHISGNPVPFCDNIIGIDIGENQDFTTDGLGSLLLNKDMSVLIANVYSSYEIPSYVTEIAPYALCFSDVTSLTIPNNVRIIRANAINCPVATSITLPIDAVIENGAITISDAFESFNLTEGVSGRGLDYTVEQSQQLPWNVYGDFIDIISFGPNINYIGAYTTYNIPASKISYSGTQEINPNAFYVPV